MERTISHPCRKRSAWIAPLAVLAAIPALGAVVPATMPEEIVFAVRQPGVGSHWYENFGYYAQDANAKAYRAMGRLCRLNVATGKLTVLLDDAKGSVRDPQVDYDGRTILFSYRPGGSDFFHLFEINVDGTGLRELTTGEYDDIEPTWLPDGRIMFCSSRANRWVNCWFSQVAILYTCDADGGNLRPVSANIEHDNAPWALADGRVIYTRWEYVDRSRVSFHHLWTANPDGTGQMVYSHSYYTLTALQYVSDGRDRVTTNLPPRAIGTSASPLMKTLDASHYDVHLTPHEKDMVRYWIESAAPYPGTYAALGSGMIGGYPKSQLDTSDRRWPSSIAAAEAIRRRCLGCHDRSMPLPQYLSDDLGLVLSNPDPDDLRIRWSRHLMFNLSRPEKSLLLLAPLSQQAGGYGLCISKHAAKHGAVFPDRTDPDYQKILALCRAGKDHLDRIGRFDMPGFRPPAMYLREMKRYGILPETLGPTDPIDVYATDRAYWRSLW